MDPALYCLAGSLLSVLSKEQENTCHGNLVTPLIAASRHEYSTGFSRTSITIEGLKPYERNDFYFEVQGPDAPTRAPNGNGAVAGVLPLAMSLGRDLHFRGEADADFLRSIEECAAFWSRWRPDLSQPVRVSADCELAPQLGMADGAIMAFSGGLDSTFALHAHKRKLVGRRSLDVKAACLIRGFDLPLDDDKAFFAAREHAENILKVYGVRLNTVTTNWRRPFTINWGLTHVLGIAAVLHLFQRQFAAGVFADDFAYDAQWMPWSNNPVTNQMLGSTAFAIRSTGASWSRTEKARIVAATPAVLRLLRVCFEKPDLARNCGQCEKCIRTRLNFCANEVREVPALGGPLQPSDLEILRPLNAESILWYEDALIRGTWPVGDPVRIKLQSIVDEYRAAPAPVSSLGVRKQSSLRRYRKRVKGQLKGLLYRMGVRIGN